MAIHLFLEGSLFRQVNVIGITGAVPVKYPFDGFGAAFACIQQGKAFLEADNVAVLPKHFL